MSLWQTQFWQDMLIASWQSEEYFVIEQDIQQKSEETKKVYVEKRRVSLGEYWLFVIGYEWEVTERLQESLQNLCREEKSLFAQIETIDYSLQPLSLEKGENSRESWDYYKKFIPPYTALIDLRQSQEDILAAMKPKGRYNIRLAAKKGVEVKKVEKTAENIKIFHALMQETNARDNFAWNTQKYYEIFLDKIKNSELYFAQHEGDILAAGIFVFEKEIAYYYYGASSNNKRNLMAPYLLQWTAIEDAKEKGCSIYDFLWVAWDEETSSPLAGVTDFKMKLSPKKSKVSGSYLSIYKKNKYRLIQLLKKVMKK